MALKPDEEFRIALLSFLTDHLQTLMTPDGQWTVKGFIDVFKNIYSISVDTKVISKILELMLLPIIERFANQQSLQIVLSREQNHYPDVSFIFPDGKKVALDMKSTYRTSADTISGFTLGAFTGYFRFRQSTKNIGSVLRIQNLRDGTGPFAQHGREVFDDYWMYYLTNDMARHAELAHPPYRNLKEYFAYKKIDQKQ